MNIASALVKTVLKDATVVAGHEALTNEIRWVHMVDHPDIAQWVKAGQLLLSTGYNWPKDDAAAQSLVYALKEKGLAGVVLAVPKFLEHFPAATVQAAQEVGLPLMELPWDISFSAITEEIHADIIQHQSAIITRSEEIHRGLTNAAVMANSLSDLAKSMSELLGRAVNFVDPDGLLLGGTDVCAEHQSRERRFMRELDSSLVFRRIQDSVKPVMVDGMPTIGMPRRLGCPIRIRGELVAIVWLDDGAQPLGELDIRASEHASIIAALHIAHRRALHLQEERLGYALVGSLFEGRFEETPAALERAKLIGWDPHADYRACLVLLDEPLPLSREGFLRRERWVERLRKHLQGMGEPPLLFVSLKQITFLLSAGSAPEPLWKALGSKGSAMAVSRIHQGTKGMEVAGSDVNSLCSMLKPGRVHHFDEVMFPRALLGDADARQMFIARKLGPLQQEKKSDALLETLEALCNEGFQLANTARRLNIHISTLRYRVERIEAILHTTLEEQQNRFELQVAVKLLRLTE